MTKALAEMREVTHRAVNALRAALATDKRPLIDTRVVDAEIDEWRPGDEIRLNPIAQDIAYSANTTDVQPQVLQLKEKNPDVVSQAWSEGLCCRSLYARAGRCEPGSRGPGR